MDLALLVALVLAGDFTLPSEVLFEPELLLELELDAAAQSPRSVRVVHPSGAPAPKALPRLHPIFSKDSPCLAAAAAKGRLRVLLAFRKDAAGALQQSSGADHRTGQYTDLDPQWANLLAAAEEVAPWTEERMRAVGEAALFTRQKRALSSDNPILRWLAAEWLRTHGAEAALDQAWGPPGSKARQAAEAKASLPPSKACGAR